MTLPKTHPLYGAVETLMPLVVQLITEIEEGRTYKSPKEVFEHIQQQAEGYIRALESAGYRVVGLEPTEEMLQRMHQKIDWCRDGQRTNTYDHESQTTLIGGKRVGTTCKQDLLDAWRAGIFAAPTITGTEKSDE